MYTIQIQDHGTRATLIALHPGAHKALSYSLPDCQPHIHWLEPGYTFDIEADALKSKLTDGQQYIVRGSWVNFTQKNPPEFTLCLTVVISTATAVAAEV